MLEKLKRSKLNRQTVTYGGGFKSIEVERELKAGKHGAGAGDE